VSAFDTRLFSVDNLAKKMRSALNKQYRKKPFVWCAKENPGVVTIASGAYREDAANMPGE